MPVEKKKEKKKKQPKLETLQRNIRKAIVECVENKHIVIEAGLWGAEWDRDKEYFVAENGEACALGALLVQKNGSVKYEERWGNAVPTQEQAAAYILGVDERWVNSFTKGFDSYLDSPISPKAGVSEAFTLGWKLAKEFCPKEEE